MRLISLYKTIILKIPMVRVCENGYQRWNPNFTMIQWLMSLDHSFIGIGFGCLREKRKLSMISSTTDIISKIPMVGMCENKFQTTLSNFTMIQWLTSPGSSFYWDRFECMREKKSFGKRKRENGFKRERAQRRVINLKRDLLRLYLLDKWPQ